MKNHLNLIIEICLICNICIYWTFNLKNSVQIVTKK